MTVDSMKVLLTALLLAMFIPTQGNADWEDNPDGKLQAQSARAVERFREDMSKTAPYFDRAYGYAVFPGINRGALGFGGGFGKGVVVEGDEVIGATSYLQLGSGIQFGIRNFAMIIFFRDKAALDAYKLSQWQMTGQTSISLANIGADATPSWNEGVAVFALGRFGLMVDFSIAGARFKYKPLPTDR